MRGLAILAAAGAAWTLTGGALPRLPVLHRPPVPGWSLATGLLGGLLTAALTLGLTAVPSVALAGALLVGAAIPTAAALKESHARSRLLERWPDLLAVLRGELAGGRSIPEGIVAAGLRLGGLYGEVADFLAEEMAAGRSFTDILEELRERLGDPVSDRVLLTLGMAQRSGGPRVAAVLSGLGVSVADELRLRRDHHAALTQQRLTAAIALVAPWALLILTVMTNPTASVAYRSPTGVSVVLGGLVATALGYLLTLRIARLSRPPRVFR